MASTFTKMISGRTAGFLLASLGAGAAATGYLMSDSAAISAEARKKLYPPRYLPKIYICDSVVSQRLQ